MGHNRGEKQGTKDRDVFLVAAAGTESSSMHNGHKTQEHKGPDIGRRETRLPHESLGLLIIPRRPLQQIRQSLNIICPSEQLGP